jgi:hypothetical protein
MRLGLFWGLKPERGVSMNVVQVIRENRFLGPIYKWMIKGVEVVPYYFYEEGLHPDQKLDLKPKLDQISVDFLVGSDIKTISAHPEVGESEEELMKRLANGCLCLGIKSQGMVAAYTWCNLKQCSYEERLIFPLKDDEAYLFDARTFKSYRGKALAPYLRYQLYIKLVEMERSIFFSVTSTFNTSALRFKEKLNARILKLFLYIYLFRKFRFNILLRNYL